MCTAKEDSSSAFFTFVISTLPYTSSFVSWMVMRPVDMFKNFLYLWYGVFKSVMALLFSNS